MDDGFLNTSKSENLQEDKKLHKMNLETSPDSDKFEKCCDALVKYSKEKHLSENDLIRHIAFLSEITKKSKYQIKILEKKIFHEILKPMLLTYKVNSDVTLECAKVYLNIAKNRNIQNKLISDDKALKELFRILLMNINTNLTIYLLNVFLHLTENIELLQQIKKKEEEKSTNLFSINQYEDGNDKESVKAVIQRADLHAMTRTFVEKLLDDMNSNNKKVMLKIIYNLYTFDKGYMTKDAIEPIIRCLGNKNNDTVIYALKILLFYTGDKLYHQELINTNFIFRMVRTYKQGIDEMDMIIVKILYNLFENKALHEIMFESNVILILSNYLTNFEVEKNEKYEEVIRNVFEICKLIIKGQEIEEGTGNKKLTGNKISNPIEEDRMLQLMIFKKAYSLAAFSKAESSILSCLSILHMMLLDFANNLLMTDENVKSVIELMPPFFKHKNLNVIKYSLSIFELIINKKSDYFQEIYVKSTNQTFSIKSLVHSIINLVNEFFPNHEILSMSCRILVKLSDIPLLHNHFLQEPQITVIRVFKDNLLKQSKILRKEYERLTLLPIGYNNKESSGNLFKKRNLLAKEGNSIDGERRHSKDSISSLTKTPNNRFQNFRQTDMRKRSASKTKEELQKKKEESLKECEDKMRENIIVLKDSFSIVANLSKCADNLEVLTNKGFLEIINEKLNENNTETLPYVVKCIQGFCQSPASVEIILQDQLISKILRIYKLYRLSLITNNSSVNSKMCSYTSKNNLPSSPKNISSANGGAACFTMLSNVNKHVNPVKKSNVYENAVCRLEVLQSLKNILESDIKLQRTFIIDRGIDVLLSDVSCSDEHLTDQTVDQLNSMILKVIYVISCNVNKLFIIYFSAGNDLDYDENENDNDIENLNENNLTQNKKRSNVSDISKDNISKAREVKLSNNCGSVGRSKSKDDDDSSSSSNIDPSDKANNNRSKSDDGSFLGSAKKKYYLQKKGENKKKEEESNLSIQEQLRKAETKQESVMSENRDTYKLSVFKSELSESCFMNRLLGVGDFEITSLCTYKELVKILINLYLNRYYLKYFTSGRVFGRVMHIIEFIMKKYKEQGDTNYEILKLIIIFLKFICEDEILIKRFLESNVIGNIIGTVNHLEFNVKVDSSELEQFYYNLSLVILRLTEFTGHTEKFAKFPDFFNILEKLYDINLMNGKIYIISIIRNIVSEKSQFFDEDSLVLFLDKIAAQSNSYVIYEYVELIKNIVHNRSICKRMKNVFKYLINEIKSNNYSHTFKKKMLDLILCLSYENANITDFALHDLLFLVKNLDININKKTTLLILMNFSSISSNFSYLRQNSSYVNDSDIWPNKKGDSKDDSTENMIEQVEGMTIKKKDFISIVNHLLDSDRFSQILIQRLLINITSIEGIDMSIISEKIMDVLIEILKISKQMQESIIIFSLALLVNVSNRNILKMELNQESSEKDIYHKDGYEELDSENKEEDNANPVIISHENNNILKLDPQDIRIVDYILQKIPNIVDTINDLFSRNNYDIASLTIMFACNLSRKINFSPFFELENQITSCIEQYVIQTCTRDLLKNDSGKFFVISIIKYCICLSTDEKKISRNRRLIESVIFLLQEEDGSLVQLTLTHNDLKENSINFVCVENQLKFLNMIMDVSKTNASKSSLNENCDDKIERKNSQANLKFERKSSFGSYSSYTEIKDIVSDFYKSFISEFANVLDSLPFDTKIKIDLNVNFMGVLTNIFKLLTEFITEVQVQVQVEFDNDEECENVDDDVYETSIQKSENRAVQQFTRKIDRDFYEKIECPTHKLILSIIVFEPSKFTEEFKSLLIYVLFLIHSNDLDKKNLLSNEDVKKWLIKAFKIQENSIQTDYFCLKIFIKSLQYDKLSDIFWKSAKFLKKIVNYLKKSEVKKERKMRIIQKECETILNIISFNPKSHKKLSAMGIYQYFKTNLVVKCAENRKLSTCTKEDYIMLVNMILNKDNKDFIQADIASLLKCIFTCKDLVNTVRIELFELYIMYTIDEHTEKKFHEDYYIIFNLLYANLKENFSDMIFLIDKFTKQSPTFAKNIVSEEEIIIKIFYDFLEFDKNFPSQGEELSCYLKILEMFLEVMELSEKMEMMINEMFCRIAMPCVKKNLRDVNILNSILNFACFFFNKFNEKHKLIPDKTDQVGNEKINNNNLNNTRTQKQGPITSWEQTSLLDTFVEKFSYCTIIDNIISNSIEYKEICPVYMLTTLLIQDEFNVLLLPLKNLHCSLFKKEFLFAFFTSFLNLSTLDIREFVFVIHLAINLTSVGTAKLPFIEDFISQVIDIYDQVLLGKYLKSPQAEKIPGENALNEDDIVNQLNDVITSLYFFCDLIKANEISSINLNKCIRFIVNILSTLTLSTEQKEILIRYYQELLSHFRINSTEDINLVFTFFIKIHRDKDMNFIEYLVFGTMLLNTRRDVLLKNIDSFLQLVTLITLEDFDKKKMMTFFKFTKQIFVCVNNNPMVTSNINLGEQIRQALKTLQNFFTVSVKKWIEKIKEDNELAAKHAKLALLLLIK